MFIPLPNCNVELRYQTGKIIHFTDTPSRAQLSDADDANFEFEAINKLETVPVTSRRLKTLREDTQKDPTHAALQTYIRESWLAKRKEVENNSSHFFKIIR